MYIIPRLFIFSSASGLTKRKVDVAAAQSLFTPNFLQIHCCDVDNKFIRNFVLTKKYGAFKFLHRRKRYPAFISAALVAHGEESPPVTRDLFRATRFLYVKLCRRYTVENFMKFSEIFAFSANIKIRFA